jgi:hypothetical protein
MTKAYPWFGVGTLVVLFGCWEPIAHGQSLSGSPSSSRITSVYTPNTSNISQLAGQQTPFLTTNYYGLMRDRPAAGNNQVPRAQTRHHGHARVQPQQRLDTRSVNNLPWFMTNAVQVKMPPPQQARHRRR